MTGLESIARFEEIFTDKVRRVAEFDRLSEELSRVNHFIFDLYLDRNDNSAIFAACQESRHLEIYAGALRDSRIYFPNGVKRIEKANWTRISAREIYKLKISQVNSWKKEKSCTSGNATVRY